MTKSASDFPVGSTVWIINDRDESMPSFTVTGNTDDQTIWYHRFPDIALPKGQSCAALANCFRSERDAVAAKANRLANTSEAKRLEWSASVQRLEAMKARLAKLEGK
jgi:hypothetical protein